MGIDWGVGYKNRVQTCLFGKWNRRHLGLGLRLRLGRVIVLDTLRGGRGLRVFTRLSLAFCFKISLCSGAGSVLVLLSWFILPELASPPMGKRRGRSGYTNDLGATVALSWVQVVELTAGVAPWTELRTKWPTDCTWSRGFATDSSVGSAAPGPVLRGTYAESCTGSSLALLLSVEATAELAFQGASIAGRERNDERPTD